MLHLSIASRLTRRSAVHTSKPLKRACESIDNRKSLFSSSKLKSSLLALPPALSVSSTRYFHRSQMSRVKIYTKTGDGGKSSLFNGERRPKSDAIFEALGTVDELNANLGVCYENAVLASHTELATSLEAIQSSLIDLGSHIATPKTSESSDEKHILRAKFDASSLLSTLETAIDTMDAELPPLRNFILPSGGLTAAHLHVARSVCRRAERTIVPLLEHGDVDEDAFKYINRLSDYFFQAARYAAFKEGKKETIYKKPRTSSSEAI